MGTMGVFVLIFWAISFFNLKKREQVVRLVCMIGHLLSLFPGSSGAC